MACVGTAVLAEDDSESGEGGKEGLRVGNSQLVGDVKIGLVLPVDERVQLDWGCVDWSVYQGEEKVELFGIQLSRPILRLGEPMVGREYFGLVFVVAEEELLLQGWRVVDESLPVVRHSRLSENMRHGQGGEDVLEELSSVDDLFCRRESAVGCVGRHHGMWWSFVLYLCGVCGSVADGLWCRKAYS